MPRPSHPARLDHSNYTWRRVQITKLFVMNFPPPSRNFIPLPSKYSPRYPVVRHIQFMSLEPIISFCASVCIKYTFQMPFLLDLAFWISHTANCEGFLGWWNVPSGAYSVTIPLSHRISCSYTGVLLTASVHPDCTGSVTSVGGWESPADCAAAVNQVPSCHKLRLDKSRTEVWTNWPLPLLVLLFLLFLCVSQIRFNSVFLFEVWRDLSASMLLVSPWRFHLSLQIASFRDCEIKAIKRRWYETPTLATFTCPYPDNSFESDRLEQWFSTCDVGECLSSVLRTLKTITTVLHKYAYLWNVLIYFRKKCHRLPVLRYFYTWI
jgi:hypothetical protein